MERDPAEQLILSIERRGRRLSKIQEIAKSLVLSMFLTSGSQGAQEMIAEVRQKPDELPHD